MMGEYVTVERKKIYENTRQRNRRGEVKHDEIVNCWKCKKPDKINEYGYYICSCRAVNYGKKGGYKSALFDSQKSQTEELHI